MTLISNISLISFSIPSLTDSGTLGIHIVSDHAGVSGEGREQLNDRTVTILYPMPFIDKLLDHAGVTGERREQPQALL